MKWVIVVVRHFELESFQDWTRVHDVLGFKNIWFQKNPSDPKKSILGSGFKNMRFRSADSLVSYGGKADSFKKVCGFKSIRIRVDGA